MKSKFLIIIIIIIVLGVMSIYSLYNSSVENADKYKIGKDEIASIKSVVGVRKIISKSSDLQSGVTSKKYVYKVDNNISDDISKYIDKLKADGFLTVNKIDLSQKVSSGKYGKTSVESDKVVFVEINYDLTGYTITLLSGTGTISESN